MCLYVPSLFHIVGVWRGFFNQPLELCYYCMCTIAVVALMGTLEYTGWLMGGSFDCFTLE